MPVNIAYIEKKGGDQATLKALFEKAPADLPEGVRNLLESQKNRINTGATRCMNMAPYWRAIDRAYEVPFESCSYSIVRDMMSRDKSQEDVLSGLKSLGLNSRSFLVDVVDENGQPVKDIKTGKTKQLLDFPTLIEVVLPMTSYYTGIREAKITSDVMSQQPLYKYSPASINEKTRAQCELITGVVEQQNAMVGYRAAERDAIGPMLRYAEAMQFPLESYYKDVVWMSDTESQVIREGVRWHTPHPTRWFCDRSDPLFRVNTDTGVRWGGYWTIVKYRDIAQSDSYWNKEKVNISKNHWFMGKYWQPYQELYPCTLKPPTFAEAGTPGASGMREEAAFTYSGTQDSSGVPLVVFFERCNPKKVGLYDYDGDVWHRFIWCGETVVACEPWGYCPMVAYLYNYDSRRERNVGLGLELMPFQDQMHNILTQYLLTMRQALQQITFYDENAVATKSIADLRNLGEKRLRTRNFVPFKPQQLADQGTRVDQLFYSPTLPTADPSVVLQGLRTCIEIMERMLGYTAQEVGAVASHEQTAYEVNIADSHASNRTQLTEASVFDAIFAKKEAIYSAFINYGSDKIVVGVAKMNGTKEKTLKEMGYKVEVDEATATAGVIGPKTPLSSVTFSSTADGDRRTADQKVALAMINVFQMVLSNGPLIEQVGVKQVLSKFNEILNWAGVPGEWRFDPQEQDPAVSQQRAGEIQQFVQGEIERFGTVLGDKVIKPMQEQVAQVGQGIEAITNALTDLRTKGEQDAAAAQQVMEQIILKQKDLEQYVVQTAQAAQIPPVQPLGELPAQAAPLIDPLTGQPIQ